MQEISDTYIFIREQPRQFLFSSTPLQTHFPVIIVKGIDVGQLLKDYKEYLLPNGWYQGDKLEDMVNFLLVESASKEFKNELHSFLRVNDNME